MLKLTWYDYKESAWIKLEINVMFHSKSCYFHILHTSGRGMARKSPVKCQAWITLPIFQVTPKKSKWTHPKTKQSAGVWYSTKKNTCLKEKTLAEVTIPFPLSKRADYCRTMIFSHGFFLWFLLRGASWKAGLKASSNGHAGKPPSAWRPQLLQPWHPCFPNVPHRMRAFWAPWRHHRIKRVGEAQCLLLGDPWRVFGRGAWPYETSGLLWIV